MALITRDQRTFLKKFVPASAFIGGLCCFTPLVLVLLGVSTVSYAASLSDILYGSYRWAFRSIALFFLLAAIAWYFYKKEKVCTLDELKRRRKSIINFVLLAVIIATVLYIIWLYVIVEVVGLAVGVW